MVTQVAPPVEGGYVTSGGLRVNGDGTIANPTGSNIRFCGQSRSDGTPCRAKALIGLDVCWWHGGAAVGVKGRVSAKALTGAQAMTAAYGAPQEITPPMALLEELWRTNGHVLWLQEKLLTSDPSTLGERLWSNGETYVQRTGTGRSASPTQEQLDAMPDAYLAVWLKLYGDERDRLINVAREAIRAGVAEKIGRLADAQGAMVALVIYRILDRLNLTTEQRGLMPVVVPEELKRLVTGELEEDDAAVPV